MEFEYKAPNWKNGGQQPPQELIENGFTPGYKPPASFFNWFWHTVSNCVDELQINFSDFERKSTQEQMQISQQIAQKLDSSEFTAEKIKEILNLSGGSQGFDADTLQGNPASYFSPSTHTHPNATASRAGLMNTTDKSKLDSLGKNLAFTGAVTGTYNGQTPASFLIPDRKGCRFIIGTSTNGWTEKDCDYLCDGTADQVEINNAINALPATGGEIVVLAGTYNITASITVNKSNVKLRGNGNATVLKRMWSNSANSNSIIQITGSYCGISNLKINGNKNSYTSLNNAGIYIYETSNILIESNNIIDCSGYGISTKTVVNCIIINNSLKNTLDGINISTRSSYNLIKNNFISDLQSENGGAGIYLISSCSNNLVHNNIISNVKKYGIILNTCENNSCVGNYIYNSEYIGINNTSSNNSLISSNYVIMCKSYGIEIFGNTGNKNNVSNNLIYKDSYADGEYSIRVVGSGNNLIANNLIWGKDYVTNNANNTFVNNKYN